MKKYILYLEDKDINDATSYYVSIIESAILGKGYECQRTNTLSDINKEYTVVVIKVTAFMRVKLHNLTQNVIIWIQGIQPEEFLMSDENKVKKILFFTLLRILEFFAIHFSSRIFYVSNEMARHYKKLYFAKNKYMVMPCFNLELDENLFNIEHRYEKPTFVYAGSMNKWQCVDQMLQIFKIVENSIHDAHLTILTMDNNEANRIISKYNVRNVDVSYVSSSKLAEELSKYKYGFLLREDVEVNRVATPTKLNSYMSSGVIPIFSDVIVDFKDHLFGNKFVVPLSDINDFKSSSNEILKFESITIRPNEVLSEYKSIFEKYYNTNKYKNLIADFIE